MYLTKITRPTQIAAIAIKSTIPVISLIGCLAQPKWSGPLPYGDHFSSISKRVQFLVKSGVQEGRPKIEVDLPMEALSLISFLKMGMGFPR